MTDSTPSKAAGARLQGLTPDEKRRLLEQLLRQRAAAPAVPAAPPLSARGDEEGPAPLSFTQERLWMLDRLDPGNPAYHIPMAVRLRGPLDAATLRDALQQLAARHPALRTTIHTGDAGPVQVVAPAAAVELPVTDLGALAEADREAEALRRAAEEISRPFDLSSGPLIRARLFRLAPEEHVFVLVLHHIVADGWSLQVLLRELTLVYEAIRSGRPRPLPELPVRYTDFARWQREWLRGEALERQLAYWRQQLAGPLPILDLATDFPRPPVYSSRAGSETLRLSASSIEAMGRLCQQESATAFMGLLAAFATLLHRLTGQEELVVGTAAAGRSRAEVEPLIGMFVNTLALRLDCSGAPSFRALLRRVRDVCRQAYGHEDVPFEQILEAIQAERDPSRPPVFQVFFNMLRFPHRQVALAGVTGEIVPLPEPGSKFDLTLYVEEDPGGISLRAVYNADLFAAPRVHAMLAQYEAILAAVTAAPDAGLADASLVTAAARSVLPDPTQPIPVRWEGSIPGRLAAAAMRHPERMALTDPHGRWTYAELAARTNRLARALAAGGIRPGDVVGIYGHRSASLAWAILGVMKAGAAFLILDPAYPPARLAACLAAAGCRGFLQLALAGPPRELEEALKGVACRVTLPATPMEADALLAAQPAEDPGDRIAPDGLAYVTFTSGSTGTPKAIAGSHRPLSHFLAWQAHSFGFTGGIRVSLLSGLAHDPLLRDLFAPLWSGGTLCIPAPETLEAPERLLQWLRREQVSIMHLTPALGQLLAQATPPDAVPLPALRWAFFGGDPLTRRHVAALRRLAPSARCVNLYGATETPQGMGYLPVEDGAAEGDRLPIGRGIADVQLLVLTKAGRLAGIGEAGEIAVRTPYLARGYRTDPELTRARFPANPFTGDPEDRLYLTGDRGRYRPDGLVECLGRLDRQVSLRGFRIELGDIEASLASFPGLKESLAVLREERPGNARIVAYLVGGWQAPPDHHAVRHHLAERLPAYMLPAASVVLERLPRTPNGKLDLRALPPPPAAHPDLDGFVAPRDTVELELCRMWQALLGLPRVGVRDNFFDLGGHSLVAVRLFGEVEERFGKRLSLTTLFNAPTVEQLADLLRSGEEQRGQWRSLVAIRHTGSRVPIFAVHAGAGQVLFYRALAHRLGDDQPFYGLQAPAGLDGTGRPYGDYRTVEELAALYVAEVRRVRPHGPYVLAGSCAGGPVALEMARRLQDAGESVAPLLIFDSWLRRTGGTLSGRVQRHRGALTQLGLWQRISYIARRLHTTAHFHLAQLSQLSLLAAAVRPHAVRALHRARGRRIPQEIVDALFLQASRSLMDRYRPQPFAGRVILFRSLVYTWLPFASPEHVGTLGWGGIPGCEVEIVDIPVNHLELLEEPRVGEVVRAIHERLDKFVQGADGGGAASRARALDPPARAAASEMRGLPSLLTAATGDDAVG